MKTLTLVSLMLGLVMLMSFSFVSADYCSPIYSVDTYGDAGFSSLKDTFYQGEIVYAKGTRTCGDADELKIKLFSPNGSFVAACSNLNTHILECPFSLESNAPAGTWRVELWRRMGGSWDDKAFATFSVLVQTQPQPATCAITITDPVQGDRFDSQPVPIRWNLSETCTPIDLFDIWYEKDGNCGLDTGNWLKVAGNLDPGEVMVSPYHYFYLWDKPSESGQYCLKIKVTSNGNRTVSGVFNVDLAKPEASLSVGDNHYGECNEGEGICYINQQTPLTLNCSDDNPDKPWQSGADYIQYRYLYPSDGVGAQWTEWFNYSGAFSFNEDSNHVLEYKCFDKVGKDSNAEYKEFAVDSVAPVLNRTVGEPKVPGLGVEPWEWYITQGTEICLTAYDPEPHPSGLDYISCRAYVSEFGENCTEENISLDERGCFRYNKDCYHELYCEAADNLGNLASLKGMDLVDSKAPETLLSYSGPYYDDGKSSWIDSVSSVVLTAYDSDPHPVGVDKTYYRYARVSEENCENPEQVQWKPTSKDSEGWLEYRAPFTMEESCHVIEYYSVDLLGNEETVKHNFVFVDKTAPVTIKHVGKPSHDCSSIWSLGQCEEGWNWKVTTDTTINLSCEDPSPHPSGIKEICYRVLWEDEILPQEGFDSIEDGWVCSLTDKVTVQFNEECEHRVEFYCVDNVNKTSKIDSELFKVEGTSYEIPLGKKWNLISVPFNLLSTNIKEVFSSIQGNVEGVWGYESKTGWQLYVPGIIENDLVELEQGKGYWVKTTENTSLLVGGSMLSPPQAVPPNIELDEGWNLIGHYGLSSKPAYCSLFSLVDTQQGFPRWSSLWGYNPGNQSFIGLTPFDFTNPGKGYWIKMEGEDSYSPSTVCWVLNPGV